MLSKLKDKPLLQWVWESANDTRLFDTVTFAVDAEEIGEVIKKFGGKYIMTSESCPSGTDRLIEVHHKGLLKADIWVNWQGDEPFINRRMIEDLVQTCDSDGSDVWTLKKKINAPQEIDNPHISKVVADSKGFVFYFSRCPIPYHRDPRPENQKIYYKHVGIYAFSNSALKKLYHSKPGYLEEAEQLEGLRFLDNGLRVRIHETEHEVFGIDLPEHIAKAEARIDKLIV
jgi:3-deoxy-manno-octulosonate cytidylyltransferase (CMP-KDO synthetase)